MKRPSPAERRQEILRFIQTRVAAGHPPTLDEIAFACGFASRSAVLKHVRALEDSGTLQPARGKARSVRVKQSSAANVPNELFEVTARDITDLTDSDFRELIARLCQARLADAGLPSTHVTWGGDQRAPDGGIDVRVQLPDSEPPAVGFPRGNIGFQVKATKMSVSEIIREMCPAGVLRPAIRDLIGARGAYIIAASDSPADAELRKRTAAMKDAVAAESGHALAHLDYYDARRLADWTNRHPGVVAWVRCKLGRPLHGWTPYGLWASTRPGKTCTFLKDTKPRLTEAFRSDRSFSLDEGLAHVRSLLAKGGNSVRLTGLSGVGKTRFAQALFEEEAAPNALPPQLAVYTDLSYGPNPAPMAVLEELMASRRRAILIVDNCGLELHQHLTSRCKLSDLVSLLTIEYDIREDQPPETNVLRLEAASPQLIQKLVQQQFPHVSNVNVETITKFADGNARVALVLANTIDANDSLAGLSDQQLFQRLFWLGKEVQQELLDSAKACALVYSFNGEDLDGELSKLAELACVPPAVLYRHVSELERRGLAQRRGPWRAVLPHAVANELARDALKDTAPPLLQKMLTTGGERLLRSFSRRLGYLHDSSEAIELVGKWLSSAGLLGDVASLSPLHMEILVNVAPVAPRRTLEAIRRAIEGPKAASFLSDFDKWSPQLVRLVRLIAYEEDLFEECLDILASFARAEPEGNRTSEVAPVIASLFMARLSGTHATLEQRCGWIKRTISAQDPHLQEIGLKALSAALECYYFTSTYGFEFGARVRDYGAAPQGAEAMEWYRAFIELATSVALRTDSAGQKARDLLANKFRTLWTVAGAFEPLEAAVDALTPAGWEGGWLSIRKTIRFDGKSLSTAAKARLKKLEERARPTTLVSRIKAIVLNGYSIAVGYEDGENGSTGYARAEAAARELGELVAKDQATLSSVLPLLVQNAQGRQWMFGEGLATKVDSLEACWESLVKALEELPEEERNVQLLRGFLAGTFERDRTAFNRFLDHAMERESLLKWLPALQVTAPLDARGCDRLLRAIADPATPAWPFQHLSLARATQSIEDRLLADILERLSLKPDGLEVAIGILYMHMHRDAVPADARLIDVARSLIIRAPISHGRGHHIDHELGTLIRLFLSGPDAVPWARLFLGAIRTGLRDLTVSRYSAPESLAAIFVAQTHLALDELVGDDADDVEGALGRRLELAGGNTSSALKDVAVQDLIDWCRAGSDKRWLRVAPLIPAFEPDQKSGSIRWSEKLLQLLRQAPDAASVAAAIVHLVEPNSWTGSRAEVIKSRLPLLDQLADILGPEHEERVAHWRRSIMRTIELEQRRELEEQRAQHESFE